METYRNFMNRIFSFEKPDFSINKERFTASQSVWQKVTDENTFHTFYGDTVVFTLEPREMDIVSEMIRILYQESPECFSEQLKKDTLHMTLHDLSSAVQRKDVTEKMQKNQEMLSGILKEKKNASPIIHMKTNYIINMVDTSVVLALCPMDEIEYLKLMVWYHAIDQVVRLPYQFTPHITLAYYRRQGMQESSARKLIQTVNRLNQRSFYMELYTKNLVYQRFQSMNNYQTILK